MGIYEHLRSFAGKPVENWTAKTVLSAKITYRIGVGYRDPDGIVWLDKFSEFLDSPNVSDVTGIIVGRWSLEFNVDSAEVVEDMVTAHHRLPNLTALFIGDITSEENEISWIVQSDVSPLFDAYPKLEYFGVRGGNGLSLGSLRHENLKSLVIQSGGLNTAVIREVGNAYLPNLTHLELWLGSREYGWNGTIEDVLPLLSPDLFPSLKYLGLRDSEIADQIAVAIAQSPVLERLDVLDLSLGTLTDQGALALIENPATRRLKKLDLHYHYCSTEMMEKLEALGIEVDVSDQKHSDHDGEAQWRYVAVGE